MDKKRRQLLASHVYEGKVHYPWGTQKGFSTCILRQSIVRDKKKKKSVDFVL